MTAPRPTLLAAIPLAAGALLLPLARRVVEAAADPDADPLDAGVADAVTTLGWLDWPAAPILAAAVLVSACAALLLARGWSPVSASSSRGREAEPGIQGVAPVAPGFRARLRRPGVTAWQDVLVIAPGVLCGAALPPLLLRAGLVVGPGAWCLLGAALLLFWRMLGALSQEAGFARGVVVPGLFGLAVLFLWEVGVRGFAVPLVLLPPPSLVAEALADRTAVLAGDFVQTVLRSALRGYVIGCGVGFGLALLCDRFVPLRRGLLPYATLLSAVPMVGFAPIAVMWFGFDWPSKAAVVAVTTFFPMLVNTLAGLGQAERLELDLMRSYAAGYGRTLLALRLPQALPFVFNALKVNSTLALIGAIVAEFFGTPITGMGFRISTEVARMNLPMVWATIAVAALAGSASYGGLSLLERAVTSWHPSYRVHR